MKISPRNTDIQKNNIHQVTTGAPLSPLPPAATRRSPTAHHLLPRTTSGIGDTTVGTPCTTATSGDSFSTGAWLWWVAPPTDGTTGTTSLPLDTVKITDPHISIPATERKIAKQTQKYRRWVRADKRWMGEPWVSLPMENGIQRKRKPPNSHWQTNREKQPKTIFKPIRSQRGFPELTGTVSTGSIQSQIYSILRKFRS